MIRISLGNIGSGKTVSEVREIALNSHIKTYSNIITKLRHQKDINAGMIVKKELIDTKKKKDGSLIPVYRETLNTDFWKEIPKPINIVLDEAHSIINARRSMSKVNIIVTDWLALIRRILGSVEGFGNLTFITQLPNRIDTIARDMATNVRYHICHYKKICKKCNLVWSETSEHPEQLYKCLRCNSYNIKKFDHKIEIFCFTSVNDYETWKNYNVKTWYKHYIINDIGKYFHLYDTLQWENLFSDLYE